MRIHTLHERSPAARLLTAAVLMIVSSPSGIAMAAEVDRADKVGVNCEPGWTAEFSDGRLGGTAPGLVRSLATVDVRGEISLYASGIFRLAGGIEVNDIARWSGRAWSRLGKGFAIPEAARTMAAFDDGCGLGSDLFVGGITFHAGDRTLHGIARWNGEQWSGVGDGMELEGFSSGVVQALIVFDDGAGPALYAGGNFTSAGGVPAQDMARWDGRKWQAVHEGLTGQDVSALAVFDDGNGLALYAIQSSPPGGDSSYYLARWDGARWSNVATFDGLVRVLHVLDDGEGPVLYAAGAFTVVNGTAANRIARWDGRRWTPLGAGVSGSIQAMCSAQNAAGGLDLFVGGLFQQAGEVQASQIARWDGRQWSAVDQGCDSNVYAIAAFDDGSRDGESVFVGGIFTFAGGDYLPSVAQLSNGEFHQLGNGLGGACSFEGTYGCTPSVLCMASALDESENKSVVYVGGDFTLAGDRDADNVAAWDGTNWSSLGGGVDGPVRAMVVASVGKARPALYVGGNFTRADRVATGPVARWDGRTWSALGTPLIEDVQALLVVPGPGGSSVLYAAGLGIARWDGAGWTQLPGVSGYVSALALYDDGLADGPVLYAATYVPHGRVYRWEGSEWTIVGATQPSTHLPGWVWALRVFDDGSGPALYVGGSFQAIEGVAARGVARWNGRAWSEVGGGVGGQVFALTEWHEPGRERPSLVAAGVFNQAGAAFISGVAKWDGERWTGFGDGVTDDLLSTDPFVYAAVEHRSRPNDAPSLFIGGMFRTVGGLSAGGIARWSCPQAGGSARAAHASGDVNRDGRVDAADLAAVLGAWGPCRPGGGCAADLDGSGAVDARDFGLVLATWRKDAP